MAGWLPSLSHSFGQIQWKLCLIEILNLLSKYAKVRNRLRCQMAIILYRLKTSMGTIIGQVLFARQRLIRSIWKRIRELLKYEGATAIGAFGVQRSQRRLKGKPSVKLEWVDRQKWIISNDWKFKVGPASDRNWRVAQHCRFVYVCTWFMLVPCHKAR